MIKCENKISTCFFHLPILFNKHLLNKKKLKSNIISCPSDREIHIQLALQVVAEGDGGQAILRMKRPMVVSSFKRWQSKGLDSMLYDGEQMEYGFVGTVLVLGGGGG